MHFQRCFRYFSNPKTVRLPFQGDIGSVEKFRVFHHFREFGIFDLALSYQIEIKRTSNGKLYSQAIIQWCSLK